MEYELHYKTIVFMYYYCIYVEDQYITSQISPLYVNSLSPRINLSVVFQAANYAINTRINETREDMQYRPRVICAWMDWYLALLWQQSINGLISNREDPGEDDPARVHIIVHLNIGGFKPAGYKIDIFACLPF